MENEETKILSQAESSSINNLGTNTSKNKANVGERVAFAVGGYVAGLASSVAGSTMLSKTNKEEVISEEHVKETSVIVEEQNATISEVSPLISDSQEVLLATDEGIRVAHVNDNASFAEAFADARAQVGSGGAFEWRGQIYNTYYEEEWNNMSATERAEYQSKVDYNLLIGETTEVKPSTQTATVETTIPANAEMIDEQSQQSGIKVLGVEAMTDQYGNQITLAAVEMDGEQALLVDVDNNGIMDVIMMDENHDGQILENEIYDVSEVQISTADLQNYIDASQNPGAIIPNNDEMPDYMNDADVGSMI